MITLPTQQTPIKTFLIITTAVLVVIMAGISLVYIATPRNQFTVNLAFLGWLGWTTLATSTLCITAKYNKECTLIFLSFFLFGFFSKAYLEPASDQVHHLYRTYEKCRDIDTGERLNRGLWQYSMNSLFLCQDDKIIKNPEKKLLYIDILHGLFIAFASTILYSLSKNSGLPARWSLLSIIIAFFFMGTDKFSYFRYYSYGPSFTSICIYWTWIATFFFRKEKRIFFFGILTSILLTVIMVVNHIQEATFLIFILFFWIIINITEKISHLKYKTMNMVSWVIILFLLFFIFPQFDWMKKTFEVLPFSNIWDKNQKIVYHWKDIHIMGKIWIPYYRVPQTIGIIGLMPLILAPFIWLNNQQSISKFVKIRIIILGVLPFFVLCTPFLHHFWVAHVKIPVYYRIAYSSLFWITITYFLYMIEIWINARLYQKSAQIS